MEGGPVGVREGLGWSAIDPALQHMNHAVCMVKFNFKVNNALYSFLSHRKGFLRCMV
jgi:hypothetical protein